MTVVEETFSEQEEDEGEEDEDDLFLLFFPSFPPFTRRELGTLYTFLSEFWEKQKIANETSLI